jgi:intein/homing endonuclease
MSYKREYLHEAEIESIELTEEEIKVACTKMRLVKWFKARSKNYWEKIEAIRETTQLTK